MTHPSIDGSAELPRHCLIYLQRAAFACAILVGGATVQVDAQQIDTAPRAAGLCVACHGIDGDSFKPNYPRLSGQPREYLVRQLLYFKEGRRKDPNMNMVATGLNPEDILNLANFFSSRARPVKASASNPQASVVSPYKKPAAAASCLRCHESHLMDPNRAPYIRGQQHRYLVKQLRDFRSGRRADTGRVMANIADGLTDMDIDNIVTYLERRQPNTRD